MSQIAWEAHVSGGVWPANPIEQAWHSNHGVRKKWGRAASGRRDISFLDVILEIRETRCRKLRNCFPAIRASLIKVLLSTFTSQLSAHRRTYEHAAACMGSRAAGPLLVRAEEPEVGDSKGTTAKHCILAAGEAQWRWRFGRRPDSGGVKILGRRREWWNDMPRPDDGAGGAQTPADKRCILVV